MPRRPDNLSDDATENKEGALATLSLCHIGPSKKLCLKFGKRLTLIAGDNGLGKSFLLDVVWWVITGNWATRPVLPLEGSRRDQDSKIPRIGFEIRGNLEQPLVGSSYFDWQTQSWIIQHDRPSVAALCVFARVDGSFVVSDETRAKLQVNNGSNVNYFTSDEVWNGKPGEIEGLVRDWINWQLSRDQDVFSKLTRVLKCLSPEDLGTLIPGEPTRIPGDPRRIPTIRHPYGDVPIVFSSAGVQNILLLSYVVIWSWQEHILAARQLDKDEVHRMVIVVDEMEAHLHPRWQRTLLPALMSIGRLLDERLDTQIIVSTHSPMILASIESEFSETSDALYHLALKGSEVVMEPLEFQKYGDISAWLTSPVFGLRHARSRGAEREIEAAKALQLSQNPDVVQIRKVSDNLRHLLAPDDPFWPRWIFFAERFGVVL